MKDSKNDALVGSLIWKTLIPQFTTELSLSMTTIIDGIIVGFFYGSKGLAAVGLGMPILSVFSIVAGVLGTGNSVICSSFIGKASRDKTNRVFTLALIWSLSLAVILTVSCIGCSEQIAVLFCGKKDVSLIPDVTQYVRGFSLGAGFIILRQLLAPLVCMEGGNRYVHVSSAAILISDLAADYISSAYLNGGMFGIGAASALSYVFGCMTLVVYCLTKNCTLRLEMAHCLSLKTSLAILREGIPTALKRFCDLVTPVLTNRFILSIASVSAMAAMSVQNSSTRFLLCLVLSLSTMVLLLTGMFYSESDRNEMEDAFRKMLMHTLVWSIGVSAVFFIFAKPIAGYYIHDDPVSAAMSATAIRWFVVGIPGLALNQCAAFYLQAIGKLRISNAIMIADRLVTTVSLVYLLGWLYGETGIFAAYGLSEILLAVILYILLCIKNRGLVTSVRQMLMLPDDYGIPEEDRFSCTITTKEDAMGISEAVHSFCIEKGIDKRRAFFAALCTEELAVNVVSYGFKKKRRRLSIRVFIGPSGGITIRLRDNGKPFDLITRQQMAEKNDADPSKNIGIRTVFGIAENVSYNAGYGMNNTVITI
ncbi:MAG: ATP-binding protein [Lachnospiraceae bacterium]|nr:ATP-binding protein [Lachnospiraceae bacterium]